MNEYFKKPALISFLVFILVFFIYVFSKYAALAYTPMNKIISNVQQVERGSIVDRNGKPLAVIISNDRYERMLKAGIDINEF